MKLYERIESNNFDEIDKNRAIELIEGGNGHLVYNENYFKLQKENEELKEDRDKFKKNLLKRITYCNELEKDLFENGSNYVIPKEKVKDKIEELKKVSNAEELEDIMNRKNYTIAELVQYVLQELIEERGEKNYEQNI